MALLGCQNIHMAFGSQPLLAGVSLQIERGERIGLLGRNGEGKSTLLAILGERRRPDRGEVVKASGVRVAYLEQQVPAEIEGTVADCIRTGDVLHAADSDHPVERLCSLMQLVPEQPFQSLSGGQKRRTLLARALIGEPDLLLLDEPTNHLDLASILWLEQFLTRFPGSLLFVTHDRAFLQRLSTRILELDRGRLTSWECGYETYLRRKEALLHAEEQQWNQFDKKLAQEEVWIRQGIKARRTRNEGRVRALEQLRLLRSQRRERGDSVRMTIQQAERTGRKVITVKNLSFAYESAPQRPIIQSFSTTVMRGDKIGVIGPNGCGKTTLLHLLLGRLAVQEGAVEHGTKLEIAYFDQHRHQLDDERDVRFNVADGNEYVTVNGCRRHVIGYLQDFLFSPDRVRQPVRCLSGGERNRLLLARLFTQPSNVLVLDEPTNDLDTETLELLETRLIEYEGTVLLVSHDRAFLDNICTGTLVFEGAGQVREYVGGYSDWQRCVGRPSAPSPRKEGPAAPNPEKTLSARKLSNKERAALEQLPRQIEGLENELLALQQQIASPEFYREPPDVIRRVQQRLAVLPEQIDAAYGQWAELDERR